MRTFSKNIISVNSTIKQAMEVMNTIEGPDMFTLFVLNEDESLVGTLTDGDVRRGLLVGKSLDNNVSEIMHKSFRYLQRNSFSLKDIDKLRAAEMELIPLLDEKKRIIKIIALKENKSVLPVDTVVMAGGEGKRLRPLTIDLPKPLLKIGDKPILEHNIDRLVSYGVDNFWLSVNYLSQKIEDYFKDGASKGVSIKYVKEKELMGTIGSITLIDKFEHESIMVINSDLLTNIDFEDFYRTFDDSGANMAVASVPYNVSIPYAVMEVEGNNIKSLKEKPIYTYYSNAGIYLIKKELIGQIPKSKFYDATDLMEHAINTKRKVIYYPIHGYWLDIGRHEDYVKALEDIKHIKF